ncbi:MAG: hypothetical protein K6G36_01255 [Candidatus Saccharibacteria bacterium]|nr:hypothetical protein [Candidatus Saccharibacteria bacterium]
MNTVERVVFVVWLVCVILYLWYLHHWSYKKLNTKHKYGKYPSPEKIYNKVKPAYVVAALFIATGTLLPFAMANFKDLLWVLLVPTVLCVVYFLISLKFAKNKKNEKALFNRVASFTLKACIVWTIVLWVPYVIFVSV